MQTREFNLKGNRVLTIHCMCLVEKWKGEARDVGFCSLIAVHFSQIGLLFMNKNLAGNVHHQQMAGIWNCLLFATNASCPSLSILIC